MHILKTVSAIKHSLHHARAAGKRIGFVPTMGALHEGHLSLIELAKQKSDCVVASIFVNPTQFGPSEDLESYPRNLENDAEKLQSVGGDILFAPSVDQIYPNGFETKVTLSQSTQGLCGAHRPGHFDGVTTVVMKLFGIVDPDVAVFGEKDFQQLTVIRRMAEDLCLDIEVIGGPLVRESDGLAMSSRNAYLAPEDRSRALSLSRGLFDARTAFEGGECSSELILARARKVIEAEKIEVEYLELRSADRLERLSVIDRDAVILVAAKVGSTRLIDNVILRI